MASSCTKKLMAKAKAAAAAKKKLAARLKTSRDKQTAAQHAAQRAFENAKEVASDAPLAKNNPPDGPDGLDEAKGGRATQETSGIFKSLQLASNIKSSDVKELGSRPMLRKLLGKAYLTSHIKVTGIRASLGPPVERYGFNFEDGYEEINLFHL